MQSKSQNSKIQTLEAELAEANQKIKRLQEQLNIQQGAKLHPIEQQILVCIYKSSSSTMGAYDIATQTNTDTNTAYRHIQELANRHFIFIIDITEPTTYGLNPLGSQYITAHNLI